MSTFIDVACATCGRKARRQREYHRTHWADRPWKCRPCIGRETASDPERLRQRLYTQIRRTTTGCWEWTGNVDSHGYGQTLYLGRRIGAHRFAYLLLVGEIPDGLVVDHLCRNRLCVNPDHLEPTTNRENVLKGVGITAQKWRSRLAEPVAPR